MNKKIKNKKDNEFWSYWPDGARKRDYSILEMQKQNFPLWRKILRVTLIVLLLVLVVFISWMSKKYR